MRKVLPIPFVAILLFGCASTTKNIENPTPQAKEWTGACRKNGNEGGQELTKGSYKRLQSSYVFNGNEMGWFVKFYTDTKCQNLFKSQKINFKCDADPTKTSAKCRQEPAGVDHAGYPVEMIIQYALKIKSTDKAVLKSRNISDDGEEETEQLQ